jgi:SAM-dependent methyltransferase
MATECTPGRILEVGSGSGNFLDMRGLKERSVIRTDISRAPWLDVICDAQRLPFAAASFDNIVMVDVLHHIQWPVLFFAEAARVLRLGGRIICIEPAITAGSYLFFHFFHPEPVVTSADPLAEGAIDVERHPFESNQAIPSLLVGRNRRRFEERFPCLRIAGVQRFDFIAYPLSGGFRAWSAIPESMLALVQSFERRIERILGPLAAFRLLIVFEKIGSAR